VSYFPQNVPSYKLKHLVERKAQEIRAYLGFSPEEPIDPFDVAEMLGLDVVQLVDVPRLPPDVATVLLGAHRDKWSGMTFYLPNGFTVVVLNSTNSPRRQAATLMEEVAHDQLHHAPSIVAVDAASGLTQRSCDRRIESEAYGVGSAILAPKVGLRAAYQRGLSMMGAADHFGASVDLIRYRSNLHGLSKLVG
jgi:hypothetical protein